MDIALVVAVLALAVAFGAVADTFWVAMFRVAPQGRFKISIDNPSSFSFLTRLGAFSIQHAKKVLSFSVRGRRGVVPLSEIKAVEYRARVTDALVQELFFGYDLTDLMGPYRDTVEWYSISAVTNAGERIPIYAGGLVHRSSGSVAGKARPVA